MKYPTMSIAEGKLALEAVRRGEAYEPQVQWISASHESSNEFDSDLLHDLVAELQELRIELGEPRGGPRDYFAKYEGFASGVVHAILDIPPSVAADHEFWIWLTLGGTQDYMPKLVSWRHGGDSHMHNALDINYGLTTDLEKGFFSRLWLRGDIGFDEARENPYELSERGDQDFWRSHILRQDFGQVPNIFRAFSLFIYPDTHKRNHVVENKVVREMAKELRRRHATSAYELLSFEDAKHLIQTVYEATVAALEHEQNGGQKSR